MGNLLGTEGARAFSGAAQGQGVNALRSLLEENPEALADLDEVTRRKIQSGEITDEELMRIAEGRKRVGTEAAVSGGLEEAAQEVSRDNSLQGMLDYAFGRDEPESAREVAGRGTGDGSFQSAVGTFSEASEILLEAAKEMRTSSDVVGVAATLANGAESAGDLFSWLTNLKPGMRHGR
jgi:hypothetical protein